MKRRTFIRETSRTGGAIALGIAGLPRPSSAAETNGPRLAWQRDESSRLFTGVSADGEPLLRAENACLLDCVCRVAGSDAPVRLGGKLAQAGSGPLRLELRHQLLKSGEGDEDLLAATLSLRNESDRPLRVEAMFLTAAQPGADLTNPRVYLPLSAAAGNTDKRFIALGVADFLEDCEQAVGTSDFSCHYLEPMASFPTERQTRALLLAPVVDIFHPSRPWRVAVFTASDEPVRFRSTGTHGPARCWEAGRTLTVVPGKPLTLRCWLHIHRGDASESWRAFHRHAHHEDHPTVDWTRKIKVHYFDFLSSAGGKNGKRGDGYDAAVPHFRDFRVGLATQHGYFPHLGDYLHPDRKSWLAMRGDKQGPAEMSLDLMRARIHATRAAGSKAGVYLHPVLFDDAGPLFPAMRDCVLVDEKGKPVLFGWQGPDTQGTNWRASMASPHWREHLLQQAQWIMELLDPDAIVVDETFAGLGYDHHPDRSGPMSGGAIDFYRKLRTLVRSFGPDRAVFGSDCSMSSFVFWFDGESGDHAYANLLCRPSYLQTPVRYLAALGDKPWRPCAWHFQETWPHQMKLARMCGAGVGVSNGWAEFTGLHGLPDRVRARMIADIATL